MRQSLFRDYQRVGRRRELLQLVKAQPALEAIRRLDGPAPDRLRSLRAAAERRRGTARAPAHSRIPALDARPARRRLAVCRERRERPLRGRRCRATSPTAWEASSAAAGALMMLSRAQQELRDAARATQAAVITPRATRLVRVADLQAFREAAIALACEGPPLDARDRLVVVPTRAAAAHLLRSLEDTLGRTGDAVLLPDFVTPDELVVALGRAAAAATAAC